jgi:tetratricopeptide (TPR) repeat protein
MGLLRDNRTDVTVAGDAHLGSGDFHKYVHIGITLEEHEASLRRREAELRAEFAKASEEQKAVLQKEYGELQGQLADVKASYERYVESLRKRIAELEQYKGVFSDEDLQAAIAALAQGDESKAVALFTAIKERAEAPIKQAAEAEFQLGLIAKDNIRYQAAYAHFVRAAELVKDNSNYPGWAGNLAHTLGQYDKAIEYFEQALASDLKTYGPDHPDVAIDRNNLGSAWWAKGEYDKAIGYYEKAVSIFELRLGAVHPSTINAKNNLEGARKQLAESKQ